MNDLLDCSDYLTLRARTDELADLYREIILDAIELPEIVTPDHAQEEGIKVSDVLSAALGAINKATGTLAQEGIVFAGDPIEIQLSGELVEFDQNSGQIFVKVSPKGKGERYGEKKR